LGAFGHVVGVANPLSKPAEGSDIVGQEGGGEQRRRYEGLEHHWDGRPPGIRQLTGLEGENEDEDDRRGLNGLFIYGLSTAQESGFVPERG
jgi:hypothetical protein